MVSGGFRGRRGWAAFHPQSTFAHLMEWNIFEKKGENEGFLLRNK